MRIVHFDQMFHPEFGDQINILPKFQVKNGHEVYIITGNSNVPHPRFKNFADNSNMDEKDKLFEQKTGVKIFRVDVKRFISGRAIFKKGFEEVVNSIEPDILFCHYNDTLIGMHYINQVKKLKYPLILDSHMLPMASKNKFKNLFRLFYKYYFTKKIKKHELIVIKTQDDDYLNSSLGIPHHLTPYISFGTDTSLFKPDQENRKKLRSKLNISENDFVVIYTGKLTEEKGGKILAETFKHKFISDKKITLITVGNITGDYEKEVKKLFDRSDNTIINLPTQKYTDLPKYYQISDLSVFPKQCSLSFFDAQSTGLPVIAEDNNINRSRLSHMNGFTYAKNDIEDFRNKIIRVINSSDYSYLSNNAMDYIKNNFDYEDLTNEYEEIIRQEVNKFNK